MQEATRFLGGDSLYQQSSLKTPSVSEESLKKPNRNETQEKIRKAQAIYQGTQPIAGTLAERYLREHRGITGNLEGKTLRYHPQLKNWMTGSTHPALVVIARDENDRFCGLQAIFLDTNTAKKATELGHHVKLSRGLIGGGALIHAGISSDHVALAEGPETALSIAQAQPDWHVYVTFGVSNVANVRFPDATTRVVICADNDGRDSGTAQSIEQSTQKLSQRGIHVWVAEPQKPLGQTKWDFNDALLTQGVESIKNDLDRAKRHNRHDEKEPFDQNIQKSPSSLPESSLVVKTPSDSIRETPPETMHTLLRRYVDMELEQTRLVNAMHTARLEDSPSANEICAQAIAHSAAIERFAE